ncbi:unnamed protein product, partial [Polarella glacialis]
LDKRLEQELDMSKIWAAIVEVRGNFKLLEFSKMDQVDMNVDRKKVTDLDRELRAWLQHHEEALKTKASVLEIGEKADSKTVEQVLVLLARQADQLATLVAQDIEQVRGALVRFLEISPDIRKASLSVGLEPREECVACRTLHRGQVVEEITGADGSMYRISAEAMSGTLGQAQLILNERLRFPASLASGLAAGTTVADCAAAATHQVSPLPQLRNLLAADAGWLAAKNVEPKADSQVLLHSRARENMASPTTPRSGAGTPRGRILRPPSAQSAQSAACDRSERTQAGTPSSRPPSARSYFPAVNAGQGLAANPPRAGGNKARSLSKTAVPTGQG